MRYDHLNFTQALRAWNPAYRAVLETRRRVTDCERQLEVALRNATSAENRLDELEARLLELDPDWRPNKRPSKLG